MSSGSSRRKLKPRSGASSCIDDTPRSASTPSTTSIPRVEHLVEVRDSRRARARRGRHTAQPSRARSSASGSRSIPMTRVAPHRACGACPPNPIVQSTNTPPREVRDARPPRPPSPVCARSHPTPIRCRAPRDVVRPRRSTARAATSARTVPRSTPRDNRCARRPERRLQSWRCREADGGMTMRPWHVELARLAVVVHAVEELQSGRMVAGHSRGACVQPRATRTSGKCGHTHP